MDEAEATNIYCQAQHTINSITRKSVEEKRALSESARTFKTLLQEELTSRKITCMQVYTDEDEKPMYVRLVPADIGKVDINTIMAIFKEIDSETIANNASEKLNNNVAKIMAKIVHDRAKSSRGGKMTLQVTNTCERGYNVNYTPPEDIVDMARQYSMAKDQLKKINENNRKLMEPHTKEKERVQTIVQDFLKHRNTAQVHMKGSDDGQNTIYYLRLNNNEQNNQSGSMSVGMRKLSKLVEHVVSEEMKARDMSCDYLQTEHYDESFWSAVCSNLQSAVKNMQSESETQPSISMNRGSVRRSRPPK